MECITVPVTMPATPSIKKQNLHYRAGPTQTKRLTGKQVRRGAR
jgi:hypothetical protein